ncbi:MAG: Na+/H+ antiporter subunit E [Inquilinaceae bacterium]
MNLFVLNIVLAFGWAAVSGDFSLSGLAAGFVLGYLALWMTRPLYGETRYFERTSRTARLIGFFLYELVVSGVRVAWDVVTPPLLSRPGIIAVPLDAETDVEIVALANLISLTPGTLSLDLSPDRRILYVHVMFLDDPDAERKAIKDGMERRLLEVMR